MRHCTTVIALRVIAATVCSIMICTAAGATPRDLSARIDALERQVAALETPEAGTLTIERAEAVRALVADVLADADTRTVALGAGGSGGHSGFFIGTADDDFRLQIMGQLQIRWLLNRQQDGPGDDTTSGFENTRTRLGFRGHVLDPTLTFFVWSGWSPTGGNFVLDAWISKDFENGWRVTAGQFKVMTWREWLVSETRLQLVERSVVTARYAPGYGQGVNVRHTTDAFRFDLAFTDGARTRNTTWNVPPVPTRGALGFPRANEYAFTARAEALFGGTWSQHVDYNSLSADEPSLLLGAAAHVQNGAYGTIDDETEIIQWTADASLELDGANLAAAVIGTHYELGAISRDELAVIVQAGWSPAENWEVFARYEWGDLDGAGTVTDELSLLTVGFSRFWRGHALKWTTDLGFSFRPVDAAWGSAAIGWRGDAPGEDGQVLLRSQMQVLF